LDDSNLAPEHGQRSWIDGEIELRAYLALLLRRWWWIASCAVAAAVAAFAVGSAMPASYEAESMVFITEPRYQVQFDPRFQTSARSELPDDAFPELATSDGVLQAVVEAYQPSPAAQIENWGVGALRRMTDADAGGDGSLLRLEVRSRSPEDAAGIANVWAEKLVNRANQVYGGDDADASFFTDRVAQAGQRVEEAEQALIAFQARNRASIVTTEFSATLKAQFDYLTSQRTIASVIQDVRGLREQLARYPEDRPLTLSDELTSLFLQFKAFNAEASVPIELQVGDAESLSQRSRSEQVEFLEHMIATLEARSSAIEEQLADLEPKILDLQEELQTLQSEERGLGRAHLLAEETFMTLSRKLEEARIAAYEGNSILQVGSPATVPQEPAGPGPLMDTALAGVVGAMIGLGAVFAWEWWREGAAQPGR
jgi:uncharacterized protein involved in exopolysaccharide biosynthesis